MYRSHAFPENQYALSNLEKLHEEQHQWSDAYAMRQKLAARGTAAEQPQHQAILAFLENEIGLAALKRNDLAEAARRFTAAIELDETNAPAYLNAGDVHDQQGNVGAAIESWERLVETAPDRAYLTFARLEPAYEAAGLSARFPDLCRRLIAASPKDWRARLALARHEGSHGHPGGALDLLFEALVINPHALALHQAIWQILSDLQLDRTLVDRYMDLTRDAIFYADPHICVRCRYRSTELLWQCPNCRDWNTFVEERIAPARVDAEA